MTKLEILEAVHAVYGDTLGHLRSEYSAQERSPVPMLDIRKTFYSWNYFYAEYLEFCAVKEQELTPVTEPEEPEED